MAATMEKIRCEHLQGATMTREQAEATYGKIKVTREQEAINEDEIDYYWFIDTGAEINLRWLKTVYKDGTESDWRVA